MDLEDAIKKGLVEEIGKDEKLIEKELKESQKDLEKAKRDFESTFFRF